MSDKPNDAVTVAADLMLNYTDDEIKADVWAHIREIVQEIVRSEVRNTLGSPDIGERFIVQNAFIFNKQVMRAVKEHFTNNGNIY
jgi:hypothetical protein